jgi:hypothetical protein
MVTGLPLFTPLRARIEKNGRWRHHASLARQGGAKGYSFSLQTAPSQKQSQGRIDFQGVRLKTEVLK